MKKIFLLPSLLLGLSQMTACAMLDALQLCVNDGTLFGCADLLVDPNPNNNDAGANPNDAGDPDAGITDAGDVDAGNIEEDAGIVDADAGSVEDDAGNADAGVAAPITPEQAREYPHWHVPIDQAAENYKDNNDDTFTDLTTGLMWREQVEMNSYTQADAQSACEGLEAASQNDWRLPTRAELLSLINVKNNNPASTLIQIPNDLFWTATLAANDTTRAWTVDFSQGFDAQEIKSSQLRTLCVRTDISNSTNNPLTAQYIITSETAFDLFTGLTWQRNTDAQKHSHANALDLCTDLILAGFDDWRLPHIQELRSLVDTTQRSPAIDANVFPNTPNDFFGQQLSWLEIATKHGALILRSAMPTMLIKITQSMCVVSVLFDVTSRSYQRRKRNNRTGKHMHSRFYASSLLMISLGASSCALLDASQVCINNGTLFGCADIEDGENVLPSDSGTLIPDDPEEEPVAAPEFPSWPILVNPPINNYQDNADGTVLDVTTSLLWQKEAGSIGISYVDAEQACADLVLGNKTDWRLPTEIELFSLLNQQRGESDQYIPEYAKRTFWSSTPVVNNTGHRWGVSFIEGTDIDLDENNINGSVLSRCVRSDPQTNTEQYTIEGETILDNLTGLIWQREASEGTFTLESAIDFCDNLDLAGISDWRLPHIQELRSIVDRTTSNPALDTTAFSVLDTEFFWSNTSVIGSSGFFNWAIFFATGFDNDVPNTNALRVRCVR